MGDEQRGGEIFRFVQTAKAGGEEGWFTTPQEFDLSALAKSFRISFTRVHDLESLEAIPLETFSENGVRLIEVLAGGEENLKIRKTFQ
jgi:2-succinyl-5-enolpyruvyl-6-hydroxy-3-cyclohexene-1-carboxylate synthase